MNKNALLKPRIYIPLIVAGWKQVDEAPDDMGMFRIRCTACGAEDVHIVCKAKMPDWCFNCGAWMNPDSVPWAALTAGEIAESYHGIGNVDGIDREEEENE